MTQEITILGRPASKKNSKQVNTNTGMIFSSKAFSTFKKNALSQLYQYRRNHYSGDLNVNYHFYQKGNFRQDFDNAMGSIDDILQDAGFFENDEQIISGYFRVHRKSTEWKTVVEITPLYLFAQGK